ncbi:MAG: sulfatase-like hydrolase/transferase [Verrucomicrobiota bacterium]
MKSAFIFLSLFAALLVQAADRPNILWITSEDNGPHLGCYGDTYATTPNLDALAKKGMLYRKAWSCAPVCAPARTTIISGMYPTSTGSEHMRSEVNLPQGFQMYPQFLRAAGYYCSNNSKEDYNLVKPGQVWDDSSGKGHWKNRAAGQPFFAIFNHTISHESQTRKRPHTAVHDPAKVRVPAYHPDTPEVRQDWAQYYDNLTTMDGLAGQNLKELAEAGLAEDTIIFYYGDHGSGMPRNKRWPYNSGLNVPLIVYFPPKFQHLAPKEYKAGGESSRLVSFVDLAPTLLSLIGEKAPAWMQGHAFAGKYDTAPQPYLYGFRGRMDERYDLVRTVRDDRYVYLRHYMPHVPYGQYLDYMFQTPTTRIWKQLYNEGKLNAAQARFWQTKPSEELYDLQNDRDEVNNLATSKDHQDILNRMRKAHEDWVMKTRDAGFLPEGELHSRAKDSSPYEVAQKDATYPLQKIHAMASLASSLKPDALPELKRGLKDSDSAVRWWAAQGILMRGEAATKQSLPELRAALKDTSSYVRSASAEALGRYGEASDLNPSLAALLADADGLKTNFYTALYALNCLDHLEGKAKGNVAAIKALPNQLPGYPGKYGSYIPRLQEHILENLGEKVTRTPDSEAPAPKAKKKKKAE